MLRDAVAAVQGDPLALVCARAVAPQDLAWAHELALWSWVRDNCEELRVDDLARAHVDERIAAAEQAMTGANAMLSSASGAREETWRWVGQPVTVPAEGLSALLSDICDEAYHQAPTLRNELVNRARLSPAVASARMRLLNRMLSHADQDCLGMEGAPPERTIHLSLFQASGMHRQDAHGHFAFGKPGADDPRRWGPVWERIEAQLSRDEAMSFATLMKDLAAPPYGLRAGPALLVIAAFVLASRNDLAIMERNSFQPDLTGAHFMRLAKSPGHFTLKLLREDAGQGGIVQALATRLQAIGACQPTLAGVSEGLFTWYNALSPHALKTVSVSPVAAAVRGALRKASEPGRLFFHDLPVSCEAISAGGAIDVERLVSSLDSALLELAAATPSLRERAVSATLHAFGAPDMAVLRSQIQHDYGPHRLDIGDQHLRAFLERALNATVSDDRWLDGIAGHLTGQRPDNWADGTLDQFDFEVQVVAGKLARWLTLAEAGKARGEGLRSVHVVGSGREQVVVVRPDRPNPQLKARLRAVRKALGRIPKRWRCLDNCWSNTPMTMWKRRGRNGNEACAQPLWRQRFRGARHLHARPGGGDGVHLLGHPQGAAGDI